VEARFAALYSSIYGPSFPALPWGYEQRCWCYALLSQDEPRVRAGCRLEIVGNALRRRFFWDLAAARFPIAPNFPTPTTNAASSTTRNGKP
jgi:hypothetical protein